MKSSQFSRPLWPLCAWVSFAVAGLVGPAIAATALIDSSAAGPGSGAIIAIGMMGSGMIAAAITGRFGVGIAVALFAGAIIFGLLRIVGLPEPQHVFWGVLAACVASASFAARGALFARSAGKKGWLIALAVVAGEAAVLATAAARPGVLPEWLLVLLPAQWASLAIQASLEAATGHEALRSACLIALGFTAGTTMLVACLWPQRWPYLVMFTSWLAMSALVFHYLP